jgi:hypothetical protein
LSRRREQAARDGKQGRGKEARERHGSNAPHFPEKAYLSQGCGLRNSMLFRSPLSEKSP